MLVCLKPNKCNWNNQCHCVLFTVANMSISAGIVANFKTVHSRISSSGPFSFKIQCMWERAVKPNFRRPSF